MRCWPALRGARRGAGPGGRRNTFTRRPTRIGRPPRPRRTARAPRPSTDCTRGHKATLATHSTKEARRWAKDAGAEFVSFGRLGAITTKKDDVHQRARRRFDGCCFERLPTRRRRRRTPGTRWTMPITRRRRGRWTRGGCCSQRGRPACHAAARYLHSHQNDCRVRRFTHTSIKDLRESFQEGHGAGCARLFDE